MKVKGFAFLIVCLFSALSVSAQNLNSLENDVINALDSRNSTGALAALSSYIEAGGSDFKDIVKTCGKNNDLVFLKALIKINPSTKKPIPYYLCLYEALAQDEEYLDLVKYIIDNNLAGINNETVTGIDKKVFTNIGKTPLNASVSGKHTEIIRYLLKRGAKPDHLTLLSACTFDSSSAFKKGSEVYNDIIARINQIVPMLIEAGADVNMGTYEYGSDSDLINNRTVQVKLPLYFAIQTGNEELVSYLVKKGAYINSPVRIAAGSFKKEVFISGKMGLDIYHPDAALAEYSFNEQYIIDYAISYFKTGSIEQLVTSQLNIINFLIKSGVDLTIKNNYGESVLMRQIDTSLFNEEDTLKNNIILELLFEAGADPNLVDNNGQTVLHKLLSLTEDKKQESLLLKYSEYLLDKGCSLDAVDKNGLTALDMAKKRKFYKLSKFLKKRSS